MDFHLLYWHWLVFGMLLILAELFIPTFAMIWFGLGAVLVGLLAWLGFAPALEWQLLIWILLSVGFTVAWFRWIKPLSTDRTKAGIAREALLGQRCLLTKVPVGNDSRGEVRFSVPVLGAETWPCLLEGAAKVGDTMIVKEILGNAVLVALADPTSASAN